MSEPWAKEHVIKGEKGTLLLVYLQPGASKSQIKGIHGDRLKISVQAPPVEGAANQALIEFVSNWLKLPSSRIHLVSGETSRQKNLWLQGFALNTLLSQKF